MNATHLPVAISTYTADPIENSSVTGKCSRSLRMGIFGSIREFRIFEFDGRRSCCFEGREYGVG